MARWRIAVVVQVEAGTMEAAQAAGDAICNEADTVLEWDSTWLDETDARLWGRNLGPVAMSSASEDDE